MILLIIKAINTLQKVAFRQPNVNSASPALFAIRSALYLLRSLITVNRIYEDNDIVRSECTSYSVVIKLA